MITNRPTSLADQVFERLENDILSGVYAKGTVFTEQDICDDFGFGMFCIFGLLEDNLPVTVPPSSLFN